MTVALALRLIVFGASSAGMAAVLGLGVFLGVLLGIAVVLMLDYGDLDAEAIDRWRFRDRSDVA